MAQLSFLRQCLQMEKNLVRNCKSHQCRRCAELAIVNKEESGKQRPDEPKENKLFLWGAERFSPFVADSGSLDLPK